ncbi:MAG: CBS domain-containing protein [Candidatus Aenigmarchaeota archaeon]|nr:CBS domain-containing protein [Candidatus Aenigmarchaeota archaeon]
MVKVKEIMKRHVVTVSPTISVKDAATIMTNNRIGSVILVDKGRPVGIVTTEDITTVVAKGKDPKKLKVKDIKKERFITVVPEEDILKISRIMVKEGVKRVPVVKDGKLEGIVTDKELLLTSPELIDILSEKLKARVERVANPTESISGICEECSDYSDGLQNIGGRWLCEGCRED